MSSWAGSPKPLGTEKEKRERLPKMSVRWPCRKTFGCPCHMHWWPTCYTPPTPVSSGLGMGAWENVRDRCEWEGPVPSEERRLPKSQGPSDPFGPDLQTVSLGEGGGDEFAVALGVGGSVLDTPSIIIIEILYQVPGCLSWRAWKSYESDECVSGWGGEHKNNHHQCGRQYIMAGLPDWKVNVICLCVCFTKG